MKDRQFNKKWKKRGLWPILDGGDYGGPSEPLGDEELLLALRRTRPSLHVFGHIHGGRGVFAARLSPKKHSNPPNYPRLV